MLQLTGPYVTCSYYYTQLLTVSRDESVFCVSIYCNLRPALQITWDLTCSSQWEKPNPCLCAAVRLIRRTKMTFQTIFWHLCQAARFQLLSGRSSKTHTAKCTNECKMPNCLFAQQAHTAKVCLKISHTRNEGQSIFCMPMVQYTVDLL
jgi:hypothetical protein